MAQKRLPRRGRPITPLDLERPASASYFASIPAVWFLALALTAAGIVFALDLTYFPSAIAPPAYILLMLVGLLAPRQRFNAVSAALCSLLCLAAPVIASAGALSGRMLAERALSVAAIWAVWRLVLRQRGEEIMRRRAEELFRASFDHAASGAAIADTDGRFLRTNESLCRFFGYPMNELMGRNWRDLTHPEDETVSELSLRRLMSGELQSFSLEKRYVHKRGHTIWGQVTVALVRDENGKPLYRTIQLMDISERKRAEEEHRASEEWFRSSFHDAGIGMAINELDGRWLKVNPALCQMFGYSEEELTSLRWQDITHPDDIELTARGRRRLLAGETAAFDVEKRFLHKNGRPIWVHLTVSFIRDAAGAPHYFTAQIVDISQRKLAERALARERQFANRIVDTQPHMILVGELAKRRLTFANKQVETSLGYSVNEFLAMGSDALSIVHPEDRPAFVDMLTRVAAARDGEIIETEYRVRHADGSWRQLLERVSVLSRDENGNAEFSIGSAQDVTERRQMEEALLESEETLRHQHNELRNLTARLLTVTEEERSRLARDLHDDFNQQLAALGLELGQIQRAADERRDDVPARLQSFQERIGELSDGVRSLAYRLHPSVLDYLGLETALDSECADFSARESVPTEFKAVRVPAGLPKDISLCLYRIAQEALRNVARHASSDRARVRLTGEPGGIRLSVRDYGSGFHPDSAKMKSGLGIVGMQERARLVDGHLTVDTEPGHGTVVEVWVPLSGRDE